MNIFKKRKMRKQVRQLLHESKLARHMREDVSQESDLDRVRTLEEKLKAQCQQGEFSRLEHTAEELMQAVNVISLPRKHPKMREYIEILVVALAVAMGFRTYFIQPFKIPTGSMQPTLNGITYEGSMEKRWHDVFPLNIATFILFGETYTEVNSRRSGTVEGPYQTRNPEDGTTVIIISGEQHIIPKNCALHVQNGSFVNEGDRLASGIRKLGDHIFVNKVVYNFTRPERGEIIVFDTSGIRHPSIKKDSFYIKRLVGLPDESIGIDKPYLTVNNERITEPEPFNRISSKSGSYRGYTYAFRSKEQGMSILTGPDEIIQVGSHEFLPFGDNSYNSLDGRYFGPVHQDNLVGPAFFVYWPLTSHWGVIK